MNYVLDNCMIPYIRKYFSTLPSTRAKSIADELIAVCDNEHSLLASSSLLRHLTENVQLGNAQRFRDLVKTSFVKLHNLNRVIIEKSEAADDLIIALFEVLMFELNLQDNIDPEKLKAIWLQLDEAEDSPVYYLATFIFYSALGLTEEAFEAEINLCKFESKLLIHQKFIEFCEPNLHIPLVLFKATGARILLDHLLEYYLLNDKIPHFCKLLFNAPELRNSFLPLVESTVFPSLLLKIWQYCLQKSTKRQTEFDKLRLPQLEALIELLYSYRKDTVSLEENGELFQEIFSKCTSIFTGFVFTKEMKAAGFSYALTSMFDIIPSFTLDTKLLLIAVMPFALSISSTEEKAADLQKAYCYILKDIPYSYIDKIFTDHECVDSFLTSLIKSSAKESVQLRQTCSKIVAHFLHSDWTFLSALMKRLNDKSVDNDSYKNLLFVFLKAFKPNNGIPRSDTVICAQTWINVYQMEADTLKSKQFRPKKGLSKLYEILSTLLQTPNFLPENLSKQGHIIVSIVFDLLLVFIQTTRLCFLAEIEVNQEQKVIQNLLDYYLLSDSFGGISETEQSNSLVRFVDTVIINGYASGLKDYFVDIEKLLKVIELSKCDELPINIIKSLDAEDIKTLKQQILEKYTVEKLSEDRETRNNIFAAFFALLQTRFPSTFDGMEDYIFELFTDNDCLSSNAMKFATAYLEVIRGSKHFAEFLSLIIFTASNILASQKFFPLSTAVLAEVKRSLSVTTFIKYIIDLPSKITILVDQFPIIGRLISKMIANLIKFRHLINEISGKESYAIRDPVFIELLSYYDHYHKQLTNLTKQLIALKNPIISRQLPFVISNCLTGEREGNLPTYNLLSGCDEASISLMSTGLPLIEKRRFGVMFPNFVESNRFTG
uniref:Uncharacterized protein n=1 Tax=Panagrolaimus superbus TaxID=310955 RepID=A0A914YYK1_9BILA